MRYCKSGPASPAGVGLHFIPLAMRVDLPLYYRTGGAGVVLAVLPSIREIADQAFVVTVTLAGFRPGDVAVARICPALPVDCTIARHIP